MAGSVNQTTIFSVKVTVNSVCHFYVVCQKKKKNKQRNNKYQELTLFLTKSDLFSLKTI